MSLFTSDRERRLWLWTLAVVVAIYSTLGLARTLEGMLRARGLLETSFLVGMLVILSGVALLAFKAKPRGLEIGVGIGVAAVYFMVFLRMAVPAERTHIIEYSMVAALIYAAIKERANQSRVPVPALLAILIATLVGVLDECIQLLLPSRVFDPFDIFFNFLASVMAVSASVSLSWARRAFKESESGG